MLHTEILGVETLRPRYADLCTPVVILLRIHSVYVLSFYFITCSRCTFSGFHKDRVLQCVAWLVRLVAVNAQFIHQFLLIWMDQDQTSDTADQLLLRLSVFDICLWYSLIIPGRFTNFLDDASSCDKSCIEFPRAKSLDCDQFPRAEESFEHDLRNVSCYRRHLFDAEFPLQYHVEFF